MNDINSSEEIINVLFKFVKENFNDFGHCESKWWWNTEEFGGSWSPFVETCFMLEAMKYEKRYKIRSCSTHDNIYNYIERCFRPEFGDRYELGKPYSKYPCRCFDVSWIKQDNSIFLALEHSEDIPTETEIKRIKSEIKYSMDEDKDVEGPTAINQLLAIRDEINKLKDCKSHFKILISRPHRFDKMKGIIEQNNPSYYNSIDYFKKRIEKDLKKDSASFNNDEKWIIILIVPDPGYPYSKADKIIFHCYEWKGEELAVIDGENKKYIIPIKKESNKMVLNNSRII